MKLGQWIRSKTSAPQLDFKLLPAQCRRNLWYYS